MMVRFGGLCCVFVGGEASGSQDVMIGVKNSERGGSDGVCSFRRSAMLVLSFVPMREMQICRLVVFNDCNVISGNASCCCPKLWILVRLVAYCSQS